MFVVLSNFSFFLSVINYAKSITQFLGLQFNLGELLSLLPSLCLRELLVGELKVHRTIISLRGLSQKLPSRHHCCSYLFVFLVTLTITAPSILFVLHVASGVFQTKTIAKDKLHRWSRARLPCSRTLAILTDRTMCVNLYKTGVDGEGRELTFGLSIRRREVLGDEIVRGYRGEERLSDYLGCSSQNRSRDIG